MVEGTEGRGGGDYRKTSHRVKLTPFQKRHGRISYMTGQKIVEHRKDGKRSLQHVVHYHCEQPTCLCSAYMPRVLLNLSMEYTYILSYSDTSSIRNDKHYRPGLGLASRRSSVLQFILHNLHV